MNEQLLQNLIATCQTTGYCVCSQPRSLKLAIVFAHNLDPSTNRLPHGHSHPGIPLLAIINDWLLGNSKHNNTYINVASYTLLKT